METFLQQLINGLVLGSIYSLVALGYTMVYGILQLINFAHGDIVMVGALVAWSVFSVFAGTGMPSVIVISLALMAAILVCMALGVGMERVAYRRLRQAPRLAPLITAIGLSIVLQYTAATIWGKQYLSLPAIFKPTTFNFGGVSVTNFQIAIFILASGVMAALMWFIKNTRYGKAMRATAQNQEVAGLMGININTIISFTFLSGAGLGAIAGVMHILYYGIGHYFMGFMLGLKAFTAAVLGGIGNVAGAMLGGLLLGLIESFAAGYIGDATNICLLQGIFPRVQELCYNTHSISIFGSNYRDVFAFLVLITVLIFRPSGIMGEKSGDRA